MAAPEDATIIVKPGRYTDCVEIEKSVIIRGEGAATSIIVDAGTENAIVSSGANVRVEGLLLRKHIDPVPEELRFGSTYTPTISGFGGRIHFVSCHVEGPVLSEETCEMSLERCVIRDGIYGLVQQSEEPMRLKGCTVSAMSAGILHECGRLEVTDCSITDCSSYGLHISEGAEFAGDRLAIARCKIGLGLGETCVHELRNSVISDCETGVASDYWNGSPIGCSFSDCRFEDCRSGLCGKGELLFSGCVFTGCRSGDGKDSPALGLGRGKYELISCEFRDNDRPLSIFLSDMDESEECEIQAVECSFEGNSKGLSFSTWQLGDVSHRLDARLEHCVISQNGELGVYVSQAKVSLIQCLVKGHEHGIGAYGSDSLVTLQNTDLADNTQAVVQRNGGKVRYTDR